MLANAYNGSPLMGMQATARSSSRSCPGSGLCLATACLPHALRESHLPWQLMLHRGQASNRHNLHPYRAWSQSCAAVHWRSGTESVACLGFLGLDSSSCLQLQPAVLKTGRVRSLWTLTRF